MLTQEQKPLKTMALRKKPLPGYVLMNNQVAPHILGISY